MKQRLIDASQIENKFLHWLNEISKDITNDIYQGSEGDGIAACLEEIREAPTIDPESLRPHGRWIQAESAWGQAQHECSCCGCKWPEYAQFFAYCPYCGAKMEDTNEN